MYFRSRKSNFARLLSSGMNHISYQKSHQPIANFREKNSGYCIGLHNIERVRVIDKLSSCRQLIQNFQQDKRQEVQAIRFAVKTIYNFVRQFEIIHSQKKLLYFKVENYENPTKTSIWTNLSHS